MAGSRARLLIIGTALVVSGTALLLIAVASADRAGEGQAEPARSAASPLATHAEAGAVVPARSALAVASAAPSGASPAASVGEAVADAARVADAAASATAVAEGGAAVEASDASVFHFPKGDVVMAKADFKRLVAIGNQLARRADVKIAIDCYGDDPGEDERAKSIGRRRAIVTRQLLVDLGVATDRIAANFPDVATAPSMAGAIQVKTTPPLAEVVQP